MPGAPTSGPCPWAGDSSSAHRGRRRSRCRRVAARVLVIEPGRAFGTGSHGSTRGCLELLERALDGAAVSRALDVGCGSGILAIAAARLGVPRVDAIDVDPDAVRGRGECQAQCRRGPGARRGGRRRRVDGAAGAARPGEPSRGRAPDARAQAHRAGRAPGGSDRGGSARPRGAGGGRRLRGGGLLARRGRRA